MAKKTDPEIDLDGKQRWWCQRCKKSAATDKTHLACDACGDPMMRMKDAIKKQVKKG
jgi:Zn finger protein HypA/HybF involved in hydrogenase expression